MAAVLKFARQHALLAVLTLAILVTRVEHVGTAYTPDATLAAMFLAGLWVPSAWGFAVLLTTAGLADQIAFWQGVSDYCLSPAYPFLLPTYACMWIGGRICRYNEARALQRLAVGVSVFVLAVGLSLVISSGSFYLLSDNVRGVTLAEYLQMNADFYAGYVFWAGAYTAAALIIRAGVLFLWRRDLPAPRAPAPRK